jgi:SAM-dependent methyltransferase/methyltransferase-like protein
MSQDLTPLNDATAWSRLPVPRLQVDFLETVARLRGMQPAEAPRARVLELGCGAGHNLVPLAERYPEARFLGIDPSVAAIEMARQLAGELSLDNVDFRQQDFLELDSQLGTFDYVIAHGVYSWVDRPVRDKVLAICRDHLSPPGIAYVSYKAYPGWHVHDMLRAMMLYDGRHATTSAEKVARARMFLEFLKVSLTENNSYDLLVGAELALLEKQGADYLWREYLQEFSHPVYFPEFVEHAKAHALQVAGDGVLGIRMQDYLDPDTEQQLASLAREEVHKELFRDVVRNRAIRQTLLCHAAVPLATSMPSELPPGMYLEGPLAAERADLDVGSKDVGHFLRPNGVRISTPLPLAKAALVHLGEAWPDYVRKEDLVAAAVERLQAAGSIVPIWPDDIARLERNLMQCVVAEAIDVHSHGPSFLPRATNTPAASRLAQAQARRGDAITNRRHEPLRLDPFDRHLIGLLDGTRDPSSLIDLLVAAAADGRLIVMNAEQQQVTDYEGTKRAFDAALPEALSRLARAALLVG